MPDIARYRFGLEYCTKKAGEAPVEEIRELWSLVASYRFLLEREQRITPAP